MDSDREHEDGFQPPTVEIQDKRELLRKVCILYIYSK